jgi:LacI family transcriptional regulator
MQSKGGAMAKKPTIEDIARLAGVSRGTVSRVLNHRPDVDRETRARVLRVIEEQRYVPSMSAAGLAGGRSRLLGMLVPVFTWPILAELVQGIGEVLRQTPYELVLYTFNDEDLTRDRSDVIDRLLATQLTAGLLAVYPGQFSAQLAELSAEGIPIAVIDDQREHRTPWVSADNAGGAYSAVRHLVELGHRRIAHIQGPHEYLVSHDRHAGYLRALLEAQITPDPALILEGDFLPLSGYARAQQLFDLPAEQRPTAIFAAADQMAYGVLRAANERGLAVPGDIAVVGFDDDAPSAHVFPPLTTVRQPLREMGETGIKLLLESLADAEDEYQELRRPFSHTTAQSSRRIVLPTSLIVRASCGAGEGATLATVATELPKLQS